LLDRRSTVYRRKRRPAQGRKLWPSDPPAPREREAELASQLRLEQVNLDALEAKLDALEKTLEGPSQR
jgi:hypothetical protein